MHDSSFWYTYGTVGPRGAREGPGGAQHPLAPPQIRLCCHLKISACGNTIVNADTLVQVIRANVKLRHLIDAASLAAVFKALQNKMCLSYLMLVTVF